MSATMDGALWPAAVALLLLAAAALLWSVVRSARENERLRMESAGVLAQKAAAETALEHSQLECEHVREQLLGAQAQIAELRERHARLDGQWQAERQAQQEKVTLLQEAREHMSLQFKQLAADILEQKGRAFSETSRQQLQQLLIPLGEKLQAFEKKVDDTYEKEAKQRFSLEREIKSLLEMNARISADADRLTKALKGESKTQGTWGEVILERVLERSGLERGREYDVQVSLKDDEGRKGQPDIVVHLPEQKDIVIDSKVSLTAYQAYFSAGDEEQRRELLKQHINSIRAHIKNLADKNYQNLAGLRTLDYVLLFLPVEAAFALAIQHDDQLFTEAFEQNIILVGPSTLLATLRTIHNVWRYEYQNKHALEIARQAGQLYDKFAAFAQDLDKIGDRLGQTQDAWNAAHNKLLSGRGNLVARVEKLKTLGARASKSLSQLNTESNDLAIGDDEDE